MAIAAAGQQTATPTTEHDTSTLIIEPPTSSIPLECGGKALELAKLHRCLDSLPKQQQLNADRAQHALTLADHDLKRGVLAPGSKELHTAIVLLSDLVKAQPEHWEFYDALNYAKQQEWIYKLPKEQRREIKSAQQALGLSQWDEAAKILDELVAAQPKEPARPESWVFYDALAYAELKQADAGTDSGRYQQALSRYDEAIALMQKEAQSDNSGVEKTCGASHMLSNKGYIHLKRNENKEAIAAYEQAAPIAHIDPQRTVAYFNLCVAYYDASDWQKAVDACSQATKDNPKNADAYLVKGKALIKTRWPSPLTGEDRDEAGKAIARYVCLAPGGAHFDEANKWLDYLQAAKPPNCNSASTTSGTDLCQ